MNLSFKIPYTVKDKITSAELSHIALAGPVAEKMAQFFEQRILSEEARNEVYREAADAFHRQVDDEAGVIGIWQGEFWGKWMLGAIRFCRYSGDVKLREFIREGVAELLTLQRPDGYLGTYRDPLFLHAAEPEKTVQAIGRTCDWNWNIWCRKYTLWAMVEAAMLLDDPAILQACERFADQLIAMLHDHHIAVRDTGTFFGVASGSIMKPILVLYRLTGKTGYLEFAREIVNDWERPDNAPPNLIANALSGKPVHRWYSHEPSWAKAYEMMSCFDGLLELYRITGTEKYLKATQSFYDLLKEHESNCVGSVGYNDQFRHAAAFLNGISEPCDAIHWMRICHELFKLTGEIRYMDSLEYTFFNAFLAGVYRDGKWGARGVRSAGRHLTALEQAKFTRNHCCVNNVPRGFLNMAETCVMTGNNSIYLNLYCDYDYTGEVKLSVRWDYFSSARIQLESPTAFTVYFRIPPWSPRTTLTLNGQSREFTGSQYAAIAIPAGRSNVELDFHLTVQVHERRETGEITEATPWHLRRICSDQPASAVQPEQLFSGPRLTLTWGPLLLARSKYLGNTEAEMFTAPTLTDKETNFTLLPKASSSGMLLTAELQSESLRTPVCDYASAGNEILTDDSFFSIFF